MKITIYTIADCQFSKQEKEYLKSHSLPYDEKSLETNKEFLTEMLAISNNFAGTPVTKIEKDDGQISILKGFTKEEFDKVLGLEEKIVPPAELAQPKTAPAEPKVAPISTPSAPTEPPTIINPVPEVKPVPEVNPEQKKLDSILNNLEQKTTPEVTPSVPAPVSPSPLPTDLPSTPNPTVATTSPVQTPPTIPDLKI